MPISKRNRRAVFWLTLVCLVVAVMPRILTASFSSQHTSITHEATRQLHLEIVTKKKESNSYTRQKTKKRKYKAPKAKFDPKTYSESEWQQLGLSQKQAEIVVKFSKRGIHSEDELASIFVIPDQLFRLIKDSVIYSPKKMFNSEKSVEREIIVVDINTSGQEKLETIPGIGPYFAKKIVEYRNQLGGFVSKEQLLEIWNFDYEKFEKVKSYVNMTATISKININTATLEKLKNHPYISYGVANSIVKMRLHKKSYQEVSEIKESKIINQELYNKIEPYLECK